MEPVVCPETSVTNNYHSLLNNPEERNSQLLGGGSLESNKGSVRVKDNLWWPRNDIMLLSSSQTFRNVVLVFETPGNCSPNDIAQRSRILQFSATRRWESQNQRSFKEIKITNVAERFSPCLSMLNLLAPELFFLILAHSVYKMWIIQEPNTLDLWNKLHFEEEKTESIYRV